MGEEKDLLSSLLLELRRGTLTISVLSQMKEPKYGYALVQSLEEKGITIDPNTLYPLLRRLESQGLLESKWETGGAKPRKYYQRTEYGTEIYKQMKTYWKNLSAGMRRDKSAFYRSSAAMETAMIPACKAPNRFSGKSGRCASKGGAA